MTKHREFGWRGLTVVSYSMIRCTVDGRTSKRRFLHSAADTVKSGALKLGTDSFGNLSSSTPSETPNQLSTALPDELRRLNEVRYRRRDMSSSSKVSNWLPFGGVELSTHRYPRSSKLLSTSAARPRDSVEPASCSVSAAVVDTHGTFLIFGCNTPTG